MKNIFKRAAALAIAALTVSALCTGVNAAPKGKDLGSIPKVLDSAVKIDGEKDAAYANALKLKVSYNAKETNPKVFADVSVLWTDGWIMTYAEITDATLTDIDAKAKTTSPWTADSIEIFVDDDNDGKNYGMQYRVDFTGYGSWKDRNANKNYYTVADIGNTFTYAAKKTATGYTAEMKVPTTAKQGASVGIMYQLNAISATYLLSEVSDNSGWTTAEYPFVKLGAPVVAATTAAATTAKAAATTTKAAAATTTKAAQTADMSLIAPIATVCLAAAGWLTVSKKRG